MLERHVYDLKLIVSELNLFKKRPCLECTKTNAKIAFRVLDQDFDHEDSSRKTLHKTFGHDLEL